MKHIYQRTALHDIEFDLVMSVLDKAGWKYDVSRLQDGRPSSIYTENKSTQIRFSDHKISQTELKRRGSNTITIWITGKPHRREFWYVRCLYLLMHGRKPPCRRNMTVKQEWFSPLVWENTKIRPSIPPYRKIKPTAR